MTTASRESVASCVEAMLYPLWDAGIQVGHQIVELREVAQDATGDVIMATELLDFRPIVGEASLIEPLRERLNESVFSEKRLCAFIEQLDLGSKRRHGQFGDSVYLLEPDLKSGSGGLRDLDSALWACRARFGTRSLEQLFEQGLLSEAAKEEIDRAVDFLWRVRNHLHHLSNRKADRLTFSEQERVAAALGYGCPEGSALPQLQRIGEMVEAFMSDYYRHARVVARTSSRLLERAKRAVIGGGPAVQQLGSDLVQCRGRLGLSDPEQLRDNPELAFRVYATAVARDMPILSRTRDAITTACEDASFCEQLRLSRAAAASFVGLLCSSKASPFASGSVLTELHDVGLLLAMIPEFEPVVGRVHHDMYHVYTVDVHSIAAVDTLHALVRGELTSTYPLAGRLAAELARPRVLFMAALLHDVGKALGGRNHAQRGADMAKAILERLDFSADEIEDVSRLILHHLTMYMVAIRRDLNDPATVSEFVGDTWDREGLRKIFLLTLADVATTNVKALTTWKLSMLNALFRTSDAYLAGSLAGVNTRSAQVRERVRSLWQDRETLGELVTFLDSMPERYFLANTPQEVLVHAQLAIEARDKSVSLSWMPSSQEGALGLCVVAEDARHLDLCVVADDRPGLLTAIAAAISAGHFDIQAAQINSRRLGTGAYQALDLFWLRAPAAGKATERRLAKMKENLAALLRGDTSAESLVHDQASRRSSRPAPAVPCEIFFDHHASEEYTVIEVLAEDRPALLYTLSRTLRELNIVIGVAKISTEGIRAVDVLYASESDGSKIASGVRAEEVRGHLLAALDREF